MVPSSNPANQPRGGSGRLTPLLGIVVAVLLILAGLPVAGVAAKEAKGKVITLGESLNDAQRTELLDFFDAGKDDQIITITTDQTVKAMDGIFPAARINSAFSSTALTCRKLGEGLDVTTQNITLVTPGLYAMALVTAGIGDATLAVAAPSTAPAQGMTALTGVFETWELAPCDSGKTSKTRQRLALEELTLTVQIGLALGTADGVQKATDVVLETQKTIVTKHLKDKKKIDAEIAAQEKAAGITIPADLRAQLVDLMTRLAKEKIDWSTFASGWTIERPSPARITMTGEGIAIRNARATATAEAEAALTATAEAETALTATAEAAAAMTATAEAEAEATLHAQMTATAGAALTATAAAQPTLTPIPPPTPTPTPPPTPTPEPVSIQGTIDSTGDGQVRIIPEAGGEAVPYPLAPSATITRDGEAAALESVKKGDRAVLTVNRSTNQVLGLVLEPAPAKQPGTETYVLAGAAMLGLLLVKRRHVSEPFVIQRKSR